ncbi:MAG TPA: EpsI family protein [Bryobacteraceae bacterium]|nr:EpsI family protein [Bryobacteraceae bacterium]
MFKFLQSSAAVAATAFLVIQGALLYSANRPEMVPAGRPLAAVPSMFGSWQLTQEGVVDQETRDVLQADDLLNRYYSDGRAGANLFVAAFRSQRTGKAPHSPKNCLPGSGWEPLNSDEYSFDPGVGAPITVNRYVVAHGNDRSLVLYWYQSRDRVVASEYKAKFWVVVDSMRLHRTDTALVRVVVPIANRDEEAATKMASDFVRSFYGTLRQYLPA